MKKVIATAAFVMFGTLFVSAQTTQKVDNMKSKAEKNLKSTELRLDTATKQSVSPQKLDTANLEKRQKEVDKKLLRRAEPKRDALNNEASKPMQQPEQGQLE